MGRRWTRDSDTSFFSRLNLGAVNVNGRAGMICSFWIVVSWWSLVKYWLTVTCSMFLGIYLRKSSFKTILFTDHCPTHRPASPLAGAHSVLYCKLARYFCWLYIHLLFQRITINDHTSSKIDYRPGISKLNGGRGLSRSATLPDKVDYGN